LIFSDWMTYFYPQIADPWHLHVGVFNLPWLFVVLSPLSLLGPYASAIVVQAVNLLSIGYISSRLGLSPIRRGLVFLSPPVLWGVFMGQFDGLLLLAYFLPIWVAPIAALIKPQVGIGAVRSFKPVWSFLLVGILLISALLVWEWPFAVQHPNVGGPLDTTARGQMWNWSIWPLGFILAPLLFISKDVRVRMGISPFLFPYAGVHSLVGPLLGLATYNIWAFVGVWLLMWLRWWLMVNTGAG